MGRAVYQSLGYISPLDGATKQLMGLVVGVGRAARIELEFG